MKIYNHEKNKQTGSAYFLYEGEMIQYDCISQIKRIENNFWKLTIFNNCSVIFEKEYKTMAAAKAAFSRLINTKYRHIV